MRIAWFTPLAQNSGAVQSTSAYVSATLLPKLIDDSRYDITLFSAEQGSLCDKPAIHYLSAARYHRENPFDLFFYQVEDNPSTDFCRFHLGLEPGVVLFHHLVFSHPGPMPLYVSPWEETRNLFLSDEPIVFPDREKKFEHRGPLGYREACLAGAALFSSPRCHVEYQRLLAAEPAVGHVANYSRYLPLPVTLPPERATHDAQLRIGLCCPPRLEARVHKLLLGIAPVQAQCEVHWLITEDERGEAEALVQEYVLHNVTLIIGRSFERWEKLLSSLDLVFHTFFSAYAEPGPYLPMSLAQGVVVVMSDFGSAEYISSEVVAKIRPGDTEAAQVRELLESVISSRSRINPVAREFAVEEHDADKVAQELCTVFSQTVDAMKKVSARNDQILAQAQKMLVQEMSDALGGARCFETLGKELELRVQQWSRV